MCTWMVIETIDYFLRNNSEVFICKMDMTKVFDKVKHSILFQKLLKRHVPPIILRFLLHAYKIQVAMVRWNGNYSAEFNITNGVKQGAVLSALLYCVYIDNLFLRLRKNRQGCWINGNLWGYLVMQMIMFCYHQHLMAYKICLTSVNNMQKRIISLSVQTRTLINVKRNVWRLLGRKGI